MSPRHYWLSTDGRTLGPIDERQLLSLMATDELGPDTLLCRTGERTWQSISELPELEWLVSEFHPTQYGADDVDTPSSRSGPVTVDDAHYDDARPSEFRPYSGGQRPPLRPRRSRVAQWARRWLGSPCALIRRLTRPAPPVRRREPHFSPPSGARRHSSNRSHEPRRSPPPR